MTNTPFSRVQILALDASNRHDLAAYARLSRIETGLVELKHKVDVAMDLATGESLEILQDVKLSIFGDDARSQAA